MGQLTTKSYDEIVKDATSVEKTEKKNEQLSRTARMTAKNNLSTARNNAEIKTLQAEDAFNAAVVAGTNIAETALALKSAKETETFYVELYSSLFPESQRNGS